MAKVLTPEDAVGILRRAAKDMPKAIVSALGVVALDAEREAKIAATTRLGVRTGRLRGSIQGRVLQGPRGPEVRLGAGDQQDLVYARIQELGGTITPRAARVLTIPTVHNRTAAGVARYPSPRDQPDLVPMVSADGTWMLRDSVSDLVMWVGVSRVTIRAKHYLRDGLDEAVKIAPDILRERFERLVDPGGG